MLPRTALLCLPGPVPPLPPSPSALVVPLWLNILLLFVFLVSRKPPCWCEVHTEKNSVLLKQTPVMASHCSCGLGRPCSGFGQCWLQQTNNLQKYVGLSKGSSAPGKSTTGVPTNLPKCGSSPQALLCTAWHLPELVVVKKMGPETQTVWARGLCLTAVAAFGHANSCD